MGKDLQRGADQAKEHPSEEFNDAPPDTSCQLLTEILNDYLRSGSSYETQAPKMLQVKSHLLAPRASWESGSEYRTEKEECGLYPRRYHGAGCRSELSTQFL